METTPTKDGFIAFLRTFVGVVSAYLPDDSEFVSLAYDESYQTVNPAIAQAGGLDFPLAVYNLGTDILFNYAQDVVNDISSISWASNVVTVTAGAEHGVSVGKTFYCEITGTLPIGYNGQVLCTSTGLTTFAYPLATNPGTATTVGSWQPLFQADAKGPYKTFFRYYRESVFGLLNPISGVMTGAGDAGTAGSIAVPDSLKNLGLADLQNYKTPYGRRYMAIAMKYGDAWSMI